MKTILIRSAIVLTLICTLTAAATADTASDAALKRKLLGYWQSGRHAYLFKSDGIIYMVEGIPTTHWDIRGGVYYEDGSPKGTVSMKGKEFEFHARDKNAPCMLCTVERCSKKDIEQLKKCCSDWMKEHE
jgi:hypothetical protein